MLIDVAKKETDMHSEIQELLSKSNMMSEYFRPLFLLKIKQAEDEEKRLHLERWNFGQCAPIGWESEEKNLLKPVLTSLGSQYEESSSSE